MKYALRIGFGTVAGGMLLLAGCSSQGGRAGNGGSSGAGGMGSGGIAAGAGATSGGRGTTIGTGGVANTGTATGGTSAGGTPAGGAGSGGTAAGETATGGTLGTGGSATGGTSGVATGCDGNAAPPTSPPDGYLTIDVNGTAREYALLLPAGYDGKIPFPVVFGFHGTTSNGQAMLSRYYGNLREAAAGRAIVVAPQGLVRNGQTGWIGSRGIEQVDVDFFDALVALLEAEYCVDAGRIFAQGHSAGGMMSNQLGCVRSTVLRGIGPVAGMGPMESSRSGTTCGGKVAAFIGHNPYECETASDSCPWAVPWATTGWPTTQFWTKKNGCDDPGAMPTAPYEGDYQTGNPLPCKSLAGCDPNYPVTLCLYDYSVSGVGPHAYPPWITKAMIDFWLALSPPPPM